MRVYGYRCCRHFRLWSSTSELEAPNTTVRVPGRSSQLVGGVLLRAPLKKPGVDGVDVDAKVMGDGAGGLAPAAAFPHLVLDFAKDQLVRLP